MTVPDPVRHHAGTRPSDLALVSDRVQWTWLDLDARVSATARVLEDGPERVAVQASTKPDLVVLVLAALRARRVLVPLSTRWTGAATLDAVRALGIDRLITDGTSDLEVETVALEDVVRTGDRGEAPPLDLEAAFTVVHTSGSTGRPKAILHSAGNHVSSARGVIGALDVSSSSRWLLDLPLYHVGGLGIVMRCVLAGATMIVSSNALSVADRIERFRPTHASFVSTQLRRLLDAGADLSSLEAVLLGGSAMPSGLIDRALEAGVPAVVSYGLTEMTSTVTATLLPPSRSDLATSGQPLEHREVRISDQGEIEVSGPTRFVGYALESEVLPAPEWHPTGDLGHFDDAGRLVVTGRPDFQFVSGGENIHPEVIEAALLAAGAIEAVVVPVPDLEFGQRPVAFVRCEGIPMRTVLEGVRETLPRFMVPAAVHEWSGAEGMKPDRQALAKQAIAKRQKV